MSKMNVAVIGAGAIGRTHIDLALRHDAVQLAAIADPTDAARELAQTRGVRWFPDYREMLDTVRPQAAIVATPNATHVSVGVDCMERGVPVLVEKPIADTVEEAQHLCDAAERSGLPLLVGHHRRHNPIIRKAREIIASGRLGMPVSANVMATWLKPDSYFDVEWRRKPGGGPILINLIHEIDLLRVLLGEIDSLQAMRSSAARGFEVEDTAAIMLRFRNGALATITLSDATVAPWIWDLASGESTHYCRQHVNSHFLCGTDASLTLPSLDIWSYRDRRGWQDPLTLERTTPHEGNPYVEQLRHLRAVVECKEPPVCSGIDAMRTLEATLAVHASADSGKRVMLHI
ncbi:Gfo/Idh/MocA family protein [Noviherbaspirillum denitrificans]|uniref:Oxidoreductase n=1 Tax=Noviherbaspirillum denitrificans TaxID=1968433 RepID=A0A254TE01_9BURK|nr:Gfo/Idh/MocA family oxidoreductase [Noviherbaspirillum denitrificans]OWW19542.1 oxidoreductase [Noviherbaspirillum denitrificans]